MLMKSYSGIALLCLSLLLPNFLLAQNEPKYLVVTRVHLNPESEFTVDQWKAHEKEYFQKVTQKNDLIVGSNVLVHYYTNDNSEMMFVTTYKTWDDIEKAGDRNNELAKAAWPDEAVRKAYFKKQSSFYTSLHSDEIYSILPNTKLLMATTEQIYYLRTSHRAFPEDPKEGELKELSDEFAKNVTLKNPLIKGYYPSRHLWGAYSNDVVEAFVYNSLSDLEKAVEEDDKLIKAHWPDEGKRKEFFEKFDKYFDNWHGDALYRHVPELRKAPPAAAAK